MCSCYGINQEDIKLLLEFGYHYDEIEQMLMDTAQLTEALLEIKPYCLQNNGGNMHMKGFMTGVSITILAQAVIAIAVIAKLTMKEGAES